MLKLGVDPEIAKVIPDPAPVLESDTPERGDDATAFAGDLDRKKIWLDSLRASIERSKEFNPAVPILVWRGKRVIIDGIERYRICSELGIEPVIEEMEFEDMSAAVRERVRRNFSSNRAAYLSDFARAEMVVNLWDRYFADEWAARGNKGGRGKKAVVRQDALAARGALCGLKRAQMGKAERIIRYARKPETERRMPNEMLDEILRRLRNGTRDIGTADGSIKGFDERVRRKFANRQVIKAELDVGVRSSWTGEANVVIQGDCVRILSQIPAGAIDRFVFSPPYYLADESAPENVIQYGEEYSPFKSWDHYCNWTLRYLVEMWRILPEGGYVVVNIDNTREPRHTTVNGKKRANRGGGRFYYHSDLIRALMNDIGLYMEFLDELVEGGRSAGMNPLDANRHEWRRLFGYPEYEPGYPSAVDVGEYIWAKSQVVAKREATGSFDNPQRRPNHEYVLFWRKGEAKPQASTMGQDDLSKGTISGWEDLAQPGEAEQHRWGDYWVLPASPDRKSEHAARFPPKLAYRMITFGGSLGDVICDPFAGTGTSLFVAARTGRQYVGIELVKNNANRARREGIRGQSEFAARNSVSGQRTIERPASVKA